MEKIQRQICMPLFAVMMVVAASAVVCAQEPTLHPVPWDNSLSLYVGHVGAWHNYTAGTVEQREIEDFVAAFRPEETVGDDPVTWHDHEINNPQSPNGWVFYSPDEGQQMQLRVIVRDTQGRLGQVVVTDRETGAALGTLIPEAGSTEIQGYVTVPPATEGFKLEIRAAAGSTTLVLAASNQLKVGDVVAITKPYGWQPNRGDDHQPCPAGVAAPFGDPRDTTGKVSTIGMMNVIACAGPVAFENDNPTQGHIPPKYPLHTVWICEDTTTQFNNAGMTDDANAEAQNAIVSARNLYQGGTPAYQDLPTLPYSRGTGHWVMDVTGELKSLVYFRYKGIKKNKATVKLFMEGKIPYQAGSGQHDPASLLIGVSLTQEEIDIYKVELPGVVMGNVWGLKAIAPGGPQANPNQNITAPVTFELRADLLPPAPGAPGLVGGTGEATVGAAWTVPAPPPAIPQNPQLAFPNDGPDKGRVVVQLGKGWGWSATGRYNMMPYSQGSVGPFNVEGPSIRNINSNLQMLLTLKIRTTSQYGNEPSKIELQRKNPDNSWTYQATGNTVTQPIVPPALTGEEIFSTGPLNPVTYRVRAQSRLGMMSPWTAWSEEFGLPIGIEFTIGITVVRQGMP